MPVDQLSGGPVARARSAVGTWGVGRRSIRAWRAGAWGAPAAPPEPGRPGPARKDTLLGAFAVALALGIFLVDAFTPLESAVAVLYVVVILIAARGFGPLGVVLTAAICISATAAAYWLMHGLFNGDSALLRCLVSLAAIGLGTVLILQNQRAAERLAEQANLLELTHDSIFVRDRSDIVTFWNRAAEDLYGWRAEEVRGQDIHELLRTDFPVDPAAIWDELTRTGRWEGELVQTVRAGRRVTVESRWALQRDVRGEPVSVLETNTDISDRKRALEALTESERRYRTIFDTTRVSILQQDWTAVRAALDGLAGQTDLERHLADNPDFVRRMRASITIVDVNAVTLRLAGVPDRSAFMRTLDEFLPEEEQTFARSLLAFARGETFYEGETEIRRRDGSTVPVLFGITFPERPEALGCVLVFAVDITERKEAQEALLAVQAELAHALRVSTLGALTASIAHEVNQPLAAIVTNAEASLRWLARDVPDLDEARAGIARVVASGTRAGEIVARIRTFLTKAPPRPTPVRLCEIIDEAALLIEREILRHEVSLRREIEPRLPPVLGERVMLQQVVINLMVNAVQAMAETRDRPRRLVVRLGRDGASARVSVIDTGPGLTDEARARVFEPFFTTKRDGMGMGLAICRTTVEAHGGRLWAAGHAGPGTAFHFTLPLPEPEAA
ncbi:PAS domain-containing sensor histidine kinase [Methylobacterium oxalidis]|uniref:histidine kinase n=1 Tax=Methylobacterium oxalidis TaxID=944322 RepID=A0A512J5U1_9HYPH|nr:PAS domain S-box protein [Methylobacterium oxalidis]GEP05325.1 PAS domain-containing sensor histidine kinase [Methylobacterium oxalidis]GJE31336.1 Adaptive-response sensory-kinase SasA [Methylobacterium oxalidis]GLS63536.1 PAS domain-containing sensor histidine kinase [Methylobacterium oxalidis]